MEQPGLGNRHRDEDGQNARKHGNTLIATLRHTWRQLRKGHPGNAKLVWLMFCTSSMNR